MLSEISDISLHPIYIDVNEYDNAIDYLEKAKHYLARPHDSYQWKWVASSLSSGLYGLMICALEYGNNERVIDFSKMSDNDKEQLKLLGDTGELENYLQRRKIIESFLHSKRAQLISFNEALKRIQKEQWMRQVVFSKVVKLSSEEVYAIKELRQLFRNNFEHYSPRLWAIHQDRFLKPAESTLKAIMALRDSGNLFLRIYQTDKLSPLINQLTQLLQQNRERIQSMKQTG